MGAWNVEKLFDITDEDEKRITQIIAAIDKLATDPDNKWARVVNTNDDHLRLWLVTAKLNDDTPDYSELPKLTNPDGLLYQRWKIECETRKKITEIERCACTILMRTVGMIGQSSQTKDDRIVRWIYRLCTHANWYWWGPRVHSNLHEDPMFDYDTYYEALPPEQRERLSFYHRSADDAILDLGGSIASYRSDNRPTGDQTTRLDRMSDITVTSSLAANIAEFHQRMISAQWYQYNDL